MSDYLIDGQILTDIADSIRGKLSSTDSYKPSEMAQAIENIPSGGSSELFSLIFYEEVKGTTVGYFSSAFCDCGYNDEYLEKLGVGRYKVIKEFSASFYALISQSSASGVAKEVYCNIYDSSGTYLDYIARDSAGGGASYPSKQTKTYTFSVGDEIRIQRKGGSTSSSARITMAISALIN